MTVQGKMESLRKILDGQIFDMSNISCNVGYELREGLLQCYVAHEIWIVWLKVFVMCIHTHEDYLQFHR